MNENEPGFGDQSRPEGGAGVAVTSPDTTSPQSRARSVVAGMFRHPGLAWVVALLTTAAAVGFALMWAPLYADARARDQVRAAAQDLLLHLTTFDGATIDEWVRDTQRLATDDYAEEVNALFDPALRAALREAEAKSVGRVVNLFVQDVDGDNATIFAVLRQTITNAAAPTPVEDELRMQVELERADGVWRAAKVEVLGPRPGAPGLPTGTAAGEGR